MSALSTRWDVCEIAAEQGEIAYETWCDIMSGREVTTKTFAHFLCCLLHYADMMEIPFEESMNKAMAIYLQDIRGFSHAEAA